MNAGAESCPSKRGGGARHRPRIGGAKASAIGAKSRRNVDGDTMAGNGELCARHRRTRWSSSSGTQTSSVAVVYARLLAASGERHRAFWRWMEQVWKDMDL